jgi:hypothetical protein
VTEFRTKNLARPDETVEMPGVTISIVQMGDLTVARAVHQPGWRWSTHVRPKVGGEWCQVRHVGVVVSGRLGVLLDDGTSYDLSPDDVVDIRPGHDGYVIGHEPCVLLEWAGIRAFTGFTGVVPKGVLTTLLLTEVVEAKARGAGAERERRSEHFESVRRHLERFKGREVKTTSTRMLATFEGSAQALYCAADICRLAQSDGLVVRVGVHVGEVEPVEGGIYGPAVAEVEAILAAAAPDEILVSETTRVLAMTAGLTFTERGGLYAYVAPNA